MKKFGFATLTAAALSTAVLGLAAPAVAAPAGPGNAQDTINSLEDRGYAIRITQQGMNKPLEQSSIVSVRYDNEDRIVYITTR
ncbi:hypothetical protein JRC04_20520 [Mycolicibacterium sp. S2-37]|uniref:hypothetical protein n=1 Tax=Mycolicibacterium sp. S2-37 TaxID=2810297 RepID=UPI001A93D3B3|nr:hypothetical protein [Mycolicibacterium sp. S2-37]MBO0679859.1 hypothetical protein [Mycolicibacterium sp. S2-37]